MELDLTQEEQRDLLDLLLVNIIYLNVVTNKPNKYVKKLGTEDQTQALEMLVKKVNDLEYLSPLLAELNVENKRLTNEDSSESVIDESTL